MNFYYKEYSTDKPEDNSRGTLIEFGLSQLKKLLEYFGIDITLQQIHPISNLLNLTRVPKDTVILKQGDIENEVNFLLCGNVMYVHKTEETSNVINLLASGNIISSIPSILNGQAADYSVISTSQCAYLSLSKEHLDNLLESPCGEKISLLFTKMMATSIYHQNQYNKMLYLPSAEKIRCLEINYPQVFDLFRLTDVAAFAGMTLETLSRTRKKMSSVDVEPCFSIFAKKQLSE
jgi:CRP-like cAMP-binding protein